MLKKRALRTIPHVYKKDARMIMDFFEVQQNKNKSLNTIMEAINAKCRIRTWHVCDLLMHAGLLSKILTSKGILYKFEGYQ